MVLGILTGLLRRSGSHTPLGNFSSKMGNKNFYKDWQGKVWNSRKERRLHPPQPPKLSHARHDRLPIKAVRMARRRARETRRARDAR